MKPRAELNRCNKCHGSGTYVWGAVVNGRPSHSGPCFACKGKGWQTERDRQRNDYYWNHVARFEI